jgi:hypothetical protein
MNDGTREDLIAVDAVKALGDVVAKGATVVIGPAASKTCLVTVMGAGFEVHEVSTEVPSLVAYACQKWLKAVAA